MSVADNCEVVDASSKDDVLDSGSCSSYDSDEESSADSTADSDETGASAETGSVDDDNPSQVEEEEEVQPKHAIAPPVLAAASHRSHLAREAEAAATQRRLQRLLSLRTVGMPAVPSSGSRTASASLVVSDLNLPQAVANDDERFLYSLLSDPTRFYRLVDHTLPDIASGVLWQASDASDVAESMRVTLSEVLPGFRETFAPPSKHDDNDVSVTTTSAVLHPCFKAAASQGVVASEDFTLHNFFLAASRRGAASQWEGKSPFCTHCDFKAFKLKSVATSVKEIGVVVWSPAWKPSHENY